MTADDYFAIQNLLYRYCDCMDRGDFNGAAALFAHADLHVPARAEPLRGAEAIAAMYTQFTRVYPDTRTPKTRHVTSNVIIEPAGEGAARAQSYVLVHQATDQLPLQPIISGRYYDRFERVGGAWRFCERRMEMDLFGNLSAHLLVPFGPDNQG
jgi:3-phenylpropionate/cinnamic acid dioxygenase small subunit